MSPDFHFRTARGSDLTELLALVNSAYRGEESKAGWTTEADLLDGLRIDDLDLMKILSARHSDSERIELACEPDGTLVGSVYYRREADTTVYLGMLAVRPRRQAGGIGSRLLEHFEKIAKAEGATRVRMTVISVRDELIAYYERRGYRRTGKSEPFPITETSGATYTRLRQGPLVLVELVKSV